MITSSRKFKKKKITSSPLIIFLIFLTLACLLIFLNLNLKITKERKKVKEELEYLKSEVQKLDLKKEEILSKISEVKSDDYLEKVSREDFSLQKEGEKVVAFPVIEEEKKTEKESQVEKVSFWQKILKKFGLR